MQFLVVGRYTEPGPLLPPEQIVPLVRGRVLPTMETCANWEEKEGRIKAGGVLAGQRVAAFIMEADTGEEIGELLSSLPLWHDLKLEVTPLQSFRSCIERESRVADQAEASTQS